MKAFIIGIAGGVGLRLARLLTADGDHVDGLYRRSEQGELLEAHGIHATRGDLTRTGAPTLAALLRGTDVLVFAAGAGGEGGTNAITAIDGHGLSTAIEAARLADVRRLLLVSVFPEAWRDREVSDTFEHYVETKKRADAELAATALDWVILRPAALTDDPGTGRISLAPALVHTQVTRDDVAATLAELVHTPRLSREILELTEGSTLIADGVQQWIRG
ncbi:SDR family oxidoreductase [Streptomyces sp. NBC_01239]|uniref:NAD(P)-binding oxidoreductase n=1 Tax=Streptomyces sp. NBC_01239 TaxID=2903792 RepID=UPI00224FC216|nr:NAD(P)-binding oxidoreductase [Streptomyces sp. NBC_01239]MCX4817832.1 SDR family oxidoreductase [Streptomyces sp. NBC_01239]